LSLRSGISIAADNPAFSPDGWWFAVSDSDGTVSLLDGRPASPETAMEREAIGLLEFVFAKPLCKNDVAEYVRNSATIRPEARQLALTLVDRYREQTDPARYHQACWAILRQPYLNSIQYHFALLQAQTARRLDPTEPKHVLALGMAQFRAGRNEAALTTLTEAVKMYPTSASALTFLAMAQHKVGQVEQAQTTLTKLREVVADTPPADAEDARAFLREAEKSMQPHSPDRGR
jgi:tetratricopeptide (TPR) repeat protein